MSTLPTVPSFVAGSPSIAQLNQLSYAVSFLCDQDVRPTWKIFMANGTQAVAANTWTAAAFDHVAYDSDGVAASLPNVQIVTRGDYSLEACVQVQAGTGKDEAVAAFLFTAGTSNPNYLAGTTVYFGYTGSNTSQTGSAVADNAMCLSSAAPMTLYQGDKLNVSVYLNAAHTLDYNQNTSYIQGRFVTQFSGYLARTGP